MLALRDRFSKSAEVSTSDLLPSLFDGFEENEEPISILDVGAGTRSTLDFFAQFRCRVHFLDLFAIQAELQATDSVTEEVAYQTFSDALSEYSETLFDVCLFWDFLNRLDAPLRRGLSNALRPYLYSQSKGYGVCDLYAGKWKKNSVYRLRDNTQLHVVPGRTMPVVHWSQSELSDQFDCFRIVQDSLSTKGRLEFLMEAD